MFCWKFKVTRYKVMGKLKSFFFFFELFLAAHVCTPFSSLVQVYVQCFLKSCLHVFNLFIGEVNYWYFSAC